MPKFLDVTDIAVAKGYLGVEEFSVTNYGATGDGVTDDTASIHQTRDAAGVGGHVVFPAGTYLVDDLTANVNDQTWYLADDAVLKMKTSSSAVVIITANGVTVQGGVFDASNGTLHDWSQHGITISGDDVTVKNATVLNSPKHGVYALNTDHTSVIGCKIIDSHNGGILIQSTNAGRSNFVVTDNNISSSLADAAGIGVATSEGYTSTNVVVSRNIISAPRASSSIQALIGVWHSENVIVDGNVLDGGWAGISSPQCSKHVISNNVIRGFWKYGIELPLDITDVLVTGNSIDVDGVNRSGQTIVGIGGSAGTVENLVISNNAIAGFTGDDLSTGISWSGTITGVVCSSNTITNANATYCYGIAFSSAPTDVVLSGNYIDGASAAASYAVVMTAGGSGIALSGNVFANFVTRCVYLTGANPYSGLVVNSNLLRNCSDGLLGGVGYTGSTSVISDSQASVSTTATAAGTTTLTSQSSEVQIFTGSSTQTCVLPTTDIGIGRRHTLLNTSSGAVTVNASGGATVTTLVGGAAGTFTALQGTPTLASHWSYDLAHADSAATADTLSTSRNISGVAFDGSADIEVVTAATVGQNYFSPGYASGNYYFCNSTQVAAVSAGLGNGTVRVTPWVVTASITVTKLFAEFTVAGDANSVFRVGIWEHNAATGKPGALVLDAGTISTGTGDAGTVATGGSPGVYEITVSQALSPGVYWVGGAVQGVSSTQPTMRTSVATVIPLIFPFGTSLPAAGATTGGFALTGQTGALGTGSWVTSGAAGARIGFKVS